MHPAPIFAAVSGSALARVVRLVASLGLLVGLLACSSLARLLDEPTDCEGDIDCPIALRCDESGVCVLRDEPDADRADVFEAPDAEVDPGADASVDASVDAGPVCTDDLCRFGIRSLSRGPTGTDGRAPNEYGWCRRPNVVTDDIGDWIDDFWPPERFPSLPVADEVVGRCGDDAETLSWRLSNCERMSRGLPPLACDVRLVWISRAHSVDMVDRAYFNHRNPDGLDPFDRMQAKGIGYRSASENIAKYPDVEAAHIGWMNSEGHRENILDREVTHLGVGVATEIASWGGLVYVMTQAFIRAP